jgi:hypothetical protein
MPGVPLRRVRAGEVMRPAAAARRLGDCRQPGAGTSFVLAHDPVEPSQLLGDDLAARVEERAWSGTPADTRCAESAPWRTSPDCRSGSRRRTSTKAAPHRTSSVLSGAAPPPQEYAANPARPSARSHRTGRSLAQTLPVKNAVRTGLTAALAVAGDP